MMITMTIRNNCFILVFIPTCLFLKLVNNFLDTDLFTRLSLLDFDGGLSRLGMLTNLPSVNITENDKDFKVELAAPGLEKIFFKLRLITIL